MKISIKKIYLPDSKSTCSFLNSLWEWLLDQLLDCQTRGRRVRFNRRRDIPLIPPIDRRKTKPRIGEMMHESLGGELVISRKSGHLLTFRAGSKCASRTIAVSHFVRDLVGIKANVAMRYVTKMNQMPRVTRHEYRSRGTNACQTPLFRDKSFVTRCPWTKK